MSAGAHLSFSASLFLSVAKNEKRPSARAEETAKLNRGFTRMRKERVGRRKEFEAST